MSLKFGGRAGEAVGQANYTNKMGPLPTKEKKKKKAKKKKSRTELIQVVWGHFVSEQNALKILRTYELIQPLTVAVGLHSQILCQAFYLIN